MLSYSYFQFPKSCITIREQFITNTEKTHKATPYAPQMYTELNVECDQQPCAVYSWFSTSVTHSMEMRGRYKLNV